MAKVYIAASFTRRKEAAALRRQLAAAHHLVLSRWLDVESDDYDNTPMSKMQQYAAMDLEDLFKSEALVCLTGDKASRGGRHAEVGAALATGKRVILLGPREQIFHWHPCVRVVTRFKELLEVLA